MGLLPLAHVGFAPTGLSALLGARIVPPRTPPVIIADKLVGLSYPKYALLATRGLVIKTFIAEQRKILARKTYSLDAAW